MKPGELYKPYGSDCVLLCVAPDTFTVEAGACPFHPSPLDGKIYFDPTPPMHRAWHWSDLATPEMAEEAEQLYQDSPDKGKSNVTAEHALSLLVAQKYIVRGILEGIKINAKLYLYENNL